MSDRLSCAMAATFYKVLWSVRIYTRTACCNGCQPAGGAIRSRARCWPSVLLYFSDAFEKALEPSWAWSLVSWGDRLHVISTCAAGFDTRCGCFAHSLLIAVCTPAIDVLVAVVMSDDCARAIDGDR